MTKVIDQGKRNNSLSEVQQIEIIEFPKFFRDKSRAKGSTSFSQTARLCI